MSGTKSPLSTRNYSVCILPSHRLLQMAYGLDLGTKDIIPSPLGSSKASQTNKQTYTRHTDKRKGENKVKSNTFTYYI